MSMIPPKSPFSKILLALALLGTMSIPVARAADDDKLSQILIPGEDWQVAARDLQFADGLSTDADGNVYFCEMRAKPPAIYKMTPDGVKTKVGDGSRSGTRRGPDGKLYAVGTNQALVYDLATGASTVLAEKISTNDLTVSAKGFLYLTEPAKNQITLIDSKTKEVKALDRGIKSPNGIGLSPDQKTLYVSDYGTTSVYAFAVQPDGTLTDKKALMTMKAPENKPAIANGDGMTIDTAGRVYVTTAMGLQIFAPSGELLGVLPKLKQSNPMSTTFGGKDLGYLYISFGDTIYRRKVQAKGALAFEMPK